ncbi:hypothetical protein PRZ48_009459 [Zasmidium cellare]|uniref:NOT2/NOT3/NOT5 C-terminal domain-containing protein n=1 Tax=Zasmidium cellare TaxID=395010 RepID=A0ABR0ECL7_ZASCE|nr:hypothetical protein PRZ48_009459 [Zasmidium cellare]
MQRKHRKPRQNRNRFIDAPPNFFPNEGTDTATDSGVDTAGGQAQPLRSMNMNAFSSQPNPRQAPRLQNTQKPALGNGAAGGGWAFGAPSSAGGFGGLGGAPGLGPSRPGQLSGFAQVMGGGGGQGPIDMSEFPSLSGPPGQQRPQQANVGWNSSVIRQPAPQQPAAAPQPQAQAPSQQPRAPSAAPSQQSIDQFDGQRSQQASTERSGGDEFPPLSGQISGETPGQTNGFNSGITSPLGPSSQPIGQPIQQSSREASSTFQQPQQASIGPAPPTQSQQTPGNQGSQPGEGFIPWYEQDEYQRFGLEALNNKLEAARGNVDISMPNIEKNVAMLQGQSLDFHDMDLDSPDQIIHSFSVFPDTEWDGRPVVPAYSLPDSYQVKNVPPAIGRVESFTDDTLFKIFFEEPRSVLSETVATELTSREWRWHKVLRKWLQKEGVTSSCTAPLIDFATHIPPGTAPTQVTERVERGVYILYENKTVQRERREITLDFADIDTRHMGPTLLSAINLGASPLSGAPNHGGQVPGASR